MLNFELKHKRSKKTICLPEQERLSLLSSWPIGHLHS